jgi:DNA-binding CsgD family transcriptional regulator
VTTLRLAPTPDEAHGNGKGALLIGRDEERALIESALAGDLRGDRRRALVFTGDAGSGKTALLNWARSRAEVSAWRVASFRAPASVSVGIADVVRHLGSLLGADEVASVLALSTAITDAGKGSGVLITLDDLHLLPDEVIGGLADAVGLSEGRVCLVATSRQPDAVNALTARSDLWVEARPLAGLSEADAGRLAAHILGGPLLPSIVQTLRTRTEGNPLFISETVQAWQRDGSIGRVGRSWATRDGVELRFPAQLHDAMRASVIRLTEAERDVARTIAVFGRAASFEEIQAICGHADADLVATLAALAERQIVSGGPRAGYDLAHPGHTSAVLADLGETLRGELSGRILNFLQGREQTGAQQISPEEIATHALAALRPPADLADVLRRAAEAALAADRFDDAARWFGHLEQACPAGSDERIHAMIGSARALARTEPVRAVELFAQARALQPALPTPVLVEWSMALSHIGRGLESLELLREAAADAPEDDLLRTRLANEEIQFGDRERGLAELEAISERGSAVASGALGAHAYSDGDVERARMLLERGLTQDPDQRGRVFLQTNLGWVLTEAGAWEAAADLMDATLTEATESSDHLRAVRVASGAVRLHARRGEIIRSLDLAMQALRNATIVGGPYAAISARHALIECHIEAGTAGEALSSMTDAIVDLFPSLDTYTISDVTLTMIEARIASGDRTVTTDEIDALEEPLRTTAGKRLALVRVRAAHALAMGDPATAADLLAPAIEEAAPFVFEQARLLQLYAEALWRTRRRAAARDAAVRALSTYERLGARLRHAAMAAWLYERFNASGGGSGSDPHGLTEREHEILTLAAEGLTNAEIGKRLYISPGTVKKHMENILAKTGATRRSELHRFVRDGKNA